MDLHQLQPVDRISELPENLLQEILKRLHVRDAARTSILSRKWRYKWLTNSEVILDFRTWKESNEEEESDHFDFAHVIYQILLCHQGPITKFALYLEKFSNSELDHCIYFLSKNGLQDFTLDVKYGWQLQLYSSLYSCQLRYLKLGSCIMSPPPAFKGFDRLVRLELNGTEIDIEALEHLISGSPLLEELLLDLTIEDEILKVYAPKLKLFKLQGWSIPVHFRNTPSLAICSFAGDFGDVEFIAFDIVEFFRSLPALQKLSINDAFIKVLTVGRVQRTLPFNMSHLKTLELIDIRSEVLDDWSFFLLLMRSSPNLEKLDIQLGVPFEDDDDDEGAVLEFLKRQDYSDISLNQLTEVKLSYFKGTAPEMELVKVLLARSPKLKSLVILPDILCEGFEFMLKKLNAFRHASPTAEILY